MRGLPRQLPPRLLPSRPEQVGSKTDAAINVGKGNGHAMLLS